MSSYQQTLDVMIHEEEGSLWAEVPSMPGVFAAGDTLDELWESLMEAVGMVLNAKVSIDEIHPPSDKTERRELILTAC